ncbi:MAG: hypothetical protein LC624_01670 [Halobacteriales archaeon]|nr:hypothetical protein [Halobacteriales archaeon]
MLLALPVPAMATHMSQYRWTPTSHDDLGRSDEPNFVGTTSILGPAVGDKVVDANRDGAAEAYAVGAPVAPGCTDNDGRQPSGLCGLYSIGAGNANSPANPVVPPHTAGTQGMGGNAAPGRFTSTKDITVRLLDMRSDFQLNPPAGGSVYFDYSHAIGDTPAAGVLAAAGASNLALLPGGTAHWAWFGDWTDRNGNGVIDAIGDQAGNVDASNEFVWAGNCVQFNGQPCPPGQQYALKLATPVSMPMWIFPGSHHAYCLQAAVGPECGLVGTADIPARNAVCFANDVGAIATGPVIGAGPTDVAVFCGDGDIRNLDDYDQDFGGDILLGTQDSVRVDQLVGDRSGDPAFTTRQWVYGTGWATYYYDQSLLVTTTTVAAVTTQVQQDTGIPQYFDLTKSSFTDVDRFNTWSPVANNLLQASAKPAVRGPYALARDSFVPLQLASDAIGNNRVFYDGCDTSYLVGAVPTVGGTCDGVPAIQGSLDDTTSNAGVPTEPNTASDILPGATFASACAAGSVNAFKGWCNSYASYASGWHAWVDVQDFPAIFTNLAWRVPGANCLLCVTGGASVLPTLPTGRTNPADHRQSLEPGTHVFSGPAGVWLDRPQAHAEKVLDVPASVAGLGLAFRDVRYTTGPDGWVGDVVNNTGFLVSRGYGAETCPIGGASASHPYAQCHPYRDGNADRPPQSYSNVLENGGEFQFASDVSGGNTVSNQLAVAVSPGSANPGAGDCWNVPVFVWRAFDTWEMGDTNAIESFQGTCGSAARITMTLGRAGGTTRDLLILPEGNLGLQVVSVVSATVTAQPPTMNGVTLPAVTEAVQDLDVYAPYGG